VYDLIIIGAGAAGLFASAYASKYYPERKILVIEKTGRAGTKLLASGSGQCNFTHAAPPAEYLPHYGKKGKSLKSVLYHTDYQFLIDFFEQLGVDSWIREDGKVFPRSLKAFDVLNALIGASRGRFIYNTKINGISVFDKYVEIDSSQGMFQARNVLWACGGKSALGDAFDYDAYRLLEALGYRIVEPKPALISPQLLQYKYACLAGISFTDISMTLIKNQGKKSFYRGDLLFTHTGLSGPVVIDAARDFELGDRLRFNLVGFNNLDRLYEDFVLKMKNNPQKTIKNLLLSYDIPEAVIVALMSELSIDRQLNSHNVRKDKLRALLERLIGLEFEIKGLGDWRKAMATCGGVDLRDINLKNMRSRLHSSFYFAGEIVDVDGDTGGYNIHFAMGSGRLALDGMLG
jgi:predicted Rossmann fold flavoprotein